MTVSSSTRSSSSGCCATYAHKTVTCGQSGLRLSPLPLLTAAMDRSAAAGARSGRVLPMSCAGSGRLLRLFKDAVAVGDPERNWLALSTRKAVAGHAVNVCNNGQT
jgi:hypothetical protein